MQPVDLSMAAIKELSAQWLFEIAGISLAILRLLSTDSGVRAFQQHSMGLNVRKKTQMKIHSQKTRTILTARFHVILWHILYSKLKTYKLMKVGKYSTCTTHSFQQLFQFPYFFHFDSKQQNVMDSSATLG